MKHFIEARQDAVKSLTDPAISALIEKICLIVDLKGKCGILVKPLPNTESTDVQNAIRQAVGKAADAFWQDKIWIEEDRSSSADKALFDTTWRQAQPEPLGQDRTFILDRRLSKDAWLGAPIQPPWPLNEHTPPIISFYSFKGGVGRTTALLALAVNLARAGKKVVTIDFDLEAPGAGATLPPAQGVPSGLGILDFLIDSAVVPQNSLDINEFFHAYDDRATIKEGEPIYALPAGTLDPWYLEKLSRVNYEYLYSSAQSNANSPLHSLFKMLRARLAPDVFLVDSRAGFHDLGGLSLSGIAHLQVLFGLGSRQSWDGIKVAIAHLGKDMLLSGGTQRDCAIVQAMVSPAGEVRKEQIQKFKETSFQVFSDNYYNAPDDGKAEWPVPDPESTESPHFPAVVSYNERLAGYSSLTEVADVLCEGEHKAVSQFILAKVGKVIS